MNDDEAAAALGITPDQFQALVEEAEHGYCMEYLGNNQYCLTPGIAVLVGGEELALCRQHRKGYPWRPKV